MSFGDKVKFVIHRNEVGDCTLYIRKYVLWVIPHTLLIADTPMHFLECLDFIKDWCVKHNIGTAIIYDPSGANKKMTINYRRFKNEELNELLQ